MVRIVPAFFAVGMNNAEMNHLSADSESSPEARTNDTVTDWSLGFKSAKIETEYFAFFDASKFQTFRVIVFFLTMFFLFYVLVLINFVSYKTVGTEIISALVWLNLFLLIICEVLLRQGKYVRICSNVAFTYSIVVCSILTAVTAASRPLRHSSSSDISYSQVVHIAAVGPAILFFVLPAVPFRLTLVMWAINTACTLYGQSQVTPLSEDPFVVFDVIFCLMLLFARHFERIQLFLAARNYESALQQKHEAVDALERREEEVAKQYRVLMANTAHDLKTPLVGMLGAMELLIADRIDLKQVIRSENITKEELWDKAQILCLETIQLVSDMKQTAQFMIQTINRVQDQAKLSQGLKLVPNLETFNCMQAIRAAVLLFGKAKFAGKVEILPFPDNICPRIISDHQWLQENILCYLSNALKFCPDGGITLRVVLQPANPPAAPLDSPTASARHSPLGSLRDDIEPPPVIDMLRIEIEDRGVGIPRDKQAQLFAPFSQAQSRAGGTGLGLYSLSKRMEALSGKYGVCDRHDGTNGALFWFSIPYRPDIGVEADMSYSSRVNGKEEKSEHSGHLSACSRALSLGDLKPCGAVALSSAPSFLSSIQVQSQKLHILLVDDSEMIVKMMKKLLEKAKYSVDTAFNGFEAINKLSQTRRIFDVVIMDINMPVMDGLEAMKRIRAKEYEFNLCYQDLAEPGHPSRSLTTCSSQKSTTNEAISISQVNAVPFKHQNIIACSANSDDATMQEALQCGADAFIVKPFTLASFQEVVNSLQRQAKL